MKGTAKPQGEIRLSQLVTTFGPGSMMDLPNHSVLIAGLDYWTPGGEAISEPRLSRKLATILDVPSIDLRTPPPATNDPTAPQRGIAGFQFPEWFIVQGSEDSDGEKHRSRLLVHRKALTKGKYIDRDKKRRTVVPVRFVRACRAGHIADIDWYEFVHNGPSECRLQGRQLFIDERGTTGDLQEIYIRCDCGKADRSLAQAAVLSNKALGACDGPRPWLGAFHTKESCGEPNRLLIRSASNAYFPQTMSVISLPDRDQAVRRAVDKMWDHLELVQNLDDLKHERRKSAVRDGLEGLTDEEVLAEIYSKHLGAPKTEKSVKVAELETLITAKDEIGEDRPDGVFFARNLPRRFWDAPWMRPIQRVVLVHRLREVVAQVGFTRFESVAPDLEGELDIGVKRASLAREVSWLPAFENRGEGVFLQFDREYLKNWMNQDAVGERAEELQRGFGEWRKEHSSSSHVAISLAYYMMHSFSHLLLTAVSLKCGYPASSIRERIYAIPEIGYGVLLYTGSSDAEGTLGGLVQVGRQIHEIVKSALELGTLCSNDPVCAQHEPASPHEHRFLHGSACHGCLLISETSCEQQNDFLDRSLVVRTVQGKGAELFSEAVTNEGITASVVAK